MKTVLLTKNQVAFVDDDLYDLVTSLNWYASGPNKQGKYYAARDERFGGVRRIVYLHQFILGISLDGGFIDHKNRNPLDCRRGNLRWASSSENLANSTRKNKLGFRGVSQHKSGLYLARVKKLGKFRWSYHKLAEEAARAYDKAAKEMYGEYAKLNFPEAR